MTLPSSICMLPWISIETSPIGTARPCCLAREEILDTQGNKYDLNKDNLEAKKGYAGLLKRCEEMEKRIR